MDEDFITTHMSLKQALRKNKERAKIFKEMPAQTRPQIGKSKALVGDE